ncbi:MAG: hypothetical protein AB8B53_09435 [Flavobacteriales bacterium]
MANLSISIVTDYRPSQINNIDILLARRSNQRESQFTILTSFPDGLNLTEGVVLTKFRGLEQGEDYNLIMRVFLNEAPFIANKTAIAFIRNEDNSASLTFRA